MPTDVQVSKGKERRRMRKERQAQIGAARALVEKACKMDDPMHNLKAFQLFNRNGLNLTINCNQVSKLSVDDIEWAFNLTKNNMKQVYDNSELKWKDRQKREEMTEDAARYLMARDSTGKPAAFVHFRYDMDDDIEVVYCYEVHLEKEYRSKGLGKFLMQILELLAFQAEMKKVVLTVFKENSRAVKFFTQTMQYSIDETSPSQYDDDDCSYEILSKKIKLKKAECNEATTSHVCCNHHHHH
ncbi:N-alpha-acetyltransferase 40 [Chamberlinius hualienensis]